MPFREFDPRKLVLKPLSERTHDIDRSALIYPGSPRKPFEHNALPVLADAIVTAHRESRQVIFACGAHVLRKGNAPLLIDLMKRGLLTHLALNGAGAIHDFELALVGATCESVARHIKTGEFGMWKETGRVNDAVTAGQEAGIGFGEAVGRMIEEEKFPFRETSVLAAGYRLKVPVTVHVAIGQDIIHQHPNFDAAATGEATYRDFLVYTKSIEGLESGVFACMGTAVMGPEVYLKALSMARNAARQEGRDLRHFTTAVFDLADIGDNTAHESEKTEHSYYFRPYKTILVRTVADGGRSFYVRGDHALTIPALYDLVVGREGA